MKHILVELETDEAMIECGNALHNALTHPVMRDSIREQGKRVFAVKQDNTFVLAVSVKTDATCNHVVASRNAPPTDEQLAVVAELLTAKGISLKYIPSTAS